MRAPATPAQINDSRGPSVVSNPCVTCALPHHGASRIASQAYTDHVAQLDRQGLQDSLKTMANVIKLDANMEAVRTSIAQMEAERPKAFVQDL